MKKTINVIICLLVAFVILGFSKCYAINVNPGENVTVTYTISSPDGTNLSTVTGQLNYDTNLLTCTQLTSSAGYASNRTISALESQINGTTMTVTATYEVKEGVKNRSTSTSINLSELYTVSSETNKVGEPIEVAINITDGETASNGSLSSNSSTPNVNTSGNSTTPEESSNANLSNLGIRPNDFTGFRPGTTTYNVTVPEDVESVEVYATAQDSGATISGTGNKPLEFGANTLSVTVTAEDGTTKTYTINVTREGTEENEEEQPEENTENTQGVNGLSNIEIRGLQISPSFSTDVYEYTVNYSGEDTSLDIQAVPTDPNYTVEIVGNEELKEGENTITILVADSQGENVATYQVTVNKTANNEEAMTIEETQNNDQMKMLVIAGGMIALILIIVIIIMIKRRRDRRYAEEFLGINDEEDDYDNDNYNYNNYNDYHTQEEDNRYDNDKDTFNNDDIEAKNEEIENKEDFINVNSDLEKDSIDDRKELEEKERAKIEFLNGYNTDYEDYSEVERTKRGRKKGKRFK